MEKNTTYPSRASVRLWVHEAASTRSGWAVAEHRQQSDDGCAENIISGAKLIRKSAMALSPPGTEDRLAREIDHVLSRRHTSYAEGKLQARQNKKVSPPTDLALRSHKCDPFCIRNYSFYPRNCFIFNCFCRRSKHPSKMRGPLGIIIPSYMTRSVRGLPWMHRSVAQCR